MEKHRHGTAAEALRNYGRGCNTQTWGTNWQRKCNGSLVSPVVRIGLRETKQRMNKSSYRKNTICNKFEVTWTCRPMKKNQVEKKPDSNDNNYPTSRQRTQDGDTQLYTPSLPPNVRCQH